VTQESDIYFTAFKLLRNDFNKISN